ncbi:MAG: aspartate aminotransferase family protein [Candidatus Eremiobacteraeota bacterium]|nr:aspartate aminotransferase family protein [Candidatus Eremiobacteraeota bacterium]
MIGELGARLGQIVVPPPGPRSKQLTKELHEYEQHNITFVSQDFPIFLAEAAGANVVDVDGNVYVDLSGFFGVSSAGHSNPQVARAVADQARQLFHGMGDVYPTENKVALAKKLCELTPGAGAKRVIFASTGSEAIEAALKTAAIATGRPGIICFTSAYHGLGYGALCVTDRDIFKQPFRAQLGTFSRRAPYPNCYRCPLGLRYPSCEAACLDAVREILDGEGGADIGAIIVEPMQGRGGEVPAPERWLVDLRRLCDERGLLLIFDEIFCGFGRTGRWFASDHAGVVSDIICVGKGLSSGFPLAACIGRADVMDCWPPSAGEAIHTGTFLGQPTGCAAALASIGEIEALDLVERTARREPTIRALLQRLQKESNGRIGDVRGRGLMWGLELVDEHGVEDTARAGAVILGALRSGVIVLTSGPHCNVVAISPPLVITDDQLQFAIDVISRAIART